MKKSVVDISDLQEAAPFFKSRTGTFLGKLLIKWLDVDKVNKVHANNCHLHGSAFTSALLSDPLINIRYNLHNAEVLDHLPEGAFITISNHPIGSVDGIMLIDIMASRRPDFKVMVNGILTKIGAMKDNFVSVMPDSTGDGPNPANINGVRYSLQRLKEGHPMGFFPAGAISFYNKEDKEVRDLPWTHSVIRLIKKANVPVYPIYFDFLNSPLFYWLGNMNWRVRTLRIPAEAFNKRGKIVDVYVGEPVFPAEMNEFTDDTSLAEFLFNKTYGAKK